MILISLLYYHKISHMATFGRNFNQIVDLPSSIVYLKLCANASIIDYLPSSIEELVLDKSFNLELNNLPNSIKKIIFNNYYNKELNCLPSSVEFLRLPYYYTHKILNIPKGLKKVICSEDYEFISDFYNINIEIETD